MKIFQAPGCPYAQRTRALLTLLDVPFESIEVDLSNKPADFLRLSPSGRVPLLEDDGFVLYESQVINEYVAERYNWKNAYSPSLQQRARERLAMKQFDDVIVPVFFKALKDPAAADAPSTWEREVDEIGATTKKSNVESLVGLHLATHWLRMNWVAPTSKVVLKLREAAGTFLDAAAALKPVAATTPDREHTTQMILKRFGPRTT